MKKMLTNSRGMNCITSIEIAEATGKLHKNVMRDIRNMEPAWEKEHGLKFEQMQIREELPNNGYRLRNVYILTKLESLYVATKFNDEARARLVLRWADLEKKAIQPLPIQKEEPLKMLVTEQEILQQGDAIRRERIERENAPADGCFTVSEIAKELEVTVKELNRMLVEDGIQYYNGGRYKLKPKYEGRGLAKDRAFHFYSLDGEKKERLYLVWTPEGVEFIKELFYME